MKPMNRTGKAGKAGKPKRKASPTNVREQTQCRFCREKRKYIDYKDIDTLSKLLTNRGKIFSRKRSGNCAHCQRMVQHAIKRARHMALLPFTT
jgi:small subunit ribosomal protein S18